MAGGGVGEAMLIGAVTGAGTSAVTGGDPLKGALLGAAGGGIGYGVAGPGAGAASGAQGAPITQAAAATPGAIPGAAPGTIGGASTTGTLTAAQAGLPEAVGQVGTSVMPSGANLQSTMLPSGDIALTDAQRNVLASQGATTAPAGTAIRPPLPSTDDTRQASKFFPKLSDLYARNPIAFPAASGAFASALGGGPKPLDKEDDDYSGPLSDFSYSRSGYTPYRAASGGLMDSAVAKRMMKGGHLGSYSDGGRLLKGPGDGMSDDIPAKIGSKQPARLADGEFVVPADVVSGLGNGSTEAGARKLYAMMDKVRHARTGSKKQGKEIDSRKYMPA